MFHVLWSSDQHDSTALFVWTKLSNRGYKARNQWVWIGVCDWSKRKQFHHSIVGQQYNPMLFPTRSMPQQRCRYWEMFPLFQPMFGENPRFVTDRSIHEKLVGLFRQNLLEPILARSFKLCMQAYCASTLEHVATDSAARTLGVVASERSATVQSMVVVKIKFFLGLKIVSHKEQTRFVWQICFCCVCHTLLLSFEWHTVSGFLL